MRRGWCVPCEEVRVGGIRKEERVNCPREQNEILDYSGIGG